MTHLFSNLFGSVLGFFCLGLFLGGRFGLRRFFPSLGFCVRCCESRIIRCLLGRSFRLQGRRRCRRRTNIVGCLRLADDVLGLGPHLLPVGDFHPEAHPHSLYAVSLRLFPTHLEDQPVSDLRVNGFRYRTGIRGLR